MPDPGGSYRAERKRAEPDELERTQSGIGALISTFTKDGPGSDGPANGSKLPVCRPGNSAAAGETGAYNVDQDIPGYSDGLPHHRVGIGHFGK